LNTTDSRFKSEMPASERQCDVRRNMCQVRC
jgi:hypothetical protein